MNLHPHPEPRPGVPGWWDRLVGPGAGAFENAGTLGGGLLGLLFGVRDVDRPVDSAVARMLALDLWGGAWANNTPACVQWYEREGQTARHHLAFAAVHLHPFLVAGIDARAGGDRRWLSYGLAHYGLVLAATALVRSCHGTARTVAAVTATAAGVALERRLGPRRTAPLFGPLLYVKLVLGHAGGSIWWRGSPTHRPRTRP